MYTKTCKHCGKTFETKAHNALYCLDCRKVVKNARRKSKGQENPFVEVKKALDGTSSALVSLGKQKSWTMTDKKPFPKIALNKRLRERLMVEVHKHLNKKYPQPSAEAVVAEMTRLADEIIPPSDLDVLRKYGTVEKGKTGFIVVCVGSATSKSYCISTHYLTEVPGTERLLIPVYKPYSWVSLEDRLQKASKDNSTLVSYARECEIWDCEIRKARKAWQEIIDSTTRVSYLPEEARPFVEKVFARQMGLEDANLNTIRRFEKED